MALTPREQFDCPGRDGGKFATLGDVNRLGAAFCAEPYASELLAGVQGYRAFRMQCLATTLRILDACRGSRFRQNVISWRTSRRGSMTMNVGTWVGLEARSRHADWRL